MCKVFFSVFSVGVGRSVKFVCSCLTVFLEFATQINTNYHTTLIKFLTLQYMSSANSRNTVKQLQTNIYT